MNKEQAYQAICKWQARNDIYEYTQQITGWLFENDPVSLAKSLNLDQEQDQTAESRYDQKLFLLNEQYAIENSMINSVNRLIKAVNNGDRPEVELLLYHIFSFEMKHVKQVADYLMFKNVKSIPDNNVWTKFIGELSPALGYTG